MKKNTPSLTAELGAMMRAVAVYFCGTRSVMQDRFANVFCGIRVIPAFCINMLILLIDRKLHHLPFDMIRVGVICSLVRHRFFEDTVAGLLQGNDAVFLILGAGYDTKSLRWQLNGTPIIELDHPATQARKRSIMLANKLYTPDTIYVSCDLAQGSLFKYIDKKALADHKRLVVMAEGLLSYFTKERICEILAELSNATREVYIVFDYRHNAESTSKTAKNWFSNFRKKGERYVGLLDMKEMDEMLDKCGYVTLEATDLALLTKRYGFDRGFENLLNVSEVRVVTKNNHPG
ncbi:MAG TPA: class I SAM-dependent methyltransferase [Chitinispirillaceae bacterium]|nr:class I SAM-dependent methyltransferase [Chitinispirillaceae bacterium]